MKYITISFGVQHNSELSRGFGSLAVIIALNVCSETCHCISR